MGLISDTSFFKLERHLFEYMCVYSMCMVVGKSSPAI